MKNTVYDPNDIARTTIKETNIDNNRTGNVNSYKKGLTYDPNDIFRHTQREEQIYNQNISNAQSEVNMGQVLG